jgi:hypothetical protein
MLTVFVQDLFVRIRGRLELLILRRAHLLVAARLPVRLGAREAAVPLGVGTVV